MSPPGYKRPSHGAQGSVSVRHTRAQRPCDARAQPPHIRTHENVTRTTRKCYVLRSRNHPPSRKLASKNVYAHNYSCKQVVTLRGFLIQGEIKREVLRTAARPSINWDQIAILEFFFPYPAVAPVAYFLRHRSVVNHASCSRESFLFR